MPKNPALLSQSVENDLAQTEQATLDERRGLAYEQEMEALPQRHLISRRGLLWAVAGALSTAVAGTGYAHLDRKSVV